jgi:tripartite-type tricarboxylate transporter receptor subunit TctC
VKTRIFLKSFAIGLALLGWSVASWSQVYPSKPVKFVVPFPAGSATDQAARLMAQQMQTLLGQTFLVENKPGAGGSIAAMDGIRSAPDGHTLLFSSNSAAASNVALLKSIPYDPLKDFTPVAAVGENMLVLMVKTDHPAKNIQEFISYAKQRPGKVNAGYGSSSSQVSIAVLNKLGGIDTMGVAYKGIPLAMNDVMAGVVDFTFVDLGNSMAQAKGGKLRPLGITANKRSSLVPDWPSLAETMPGFDITAWFALVGPAGMPKDVVDKLNATMGQALKSKDAQEKLAGIGIQPVVMTPDQLKTFMASEVSKWVRLVKEANIQPD